MKKIFQLFIKIMKITVIYMIKLDKKYYVYTHVIQEEIIGGLGISGTF
jgi:hypothetical protein